MKLPLFKVFCSTCKIGYYIDVDLQCNFCNSSIPHCYSCNYRNKYNFLCEIVS